MLLLSAVVARTVRMTPSTATATATATATTPRGRPLPSRRSLHCCVVGAGPAGFYAAEELLLRRATYGLEKSDDDGDGDGDGDSDGEWTVDVVDRLPAPFGLVRYGVAPDHPEVKAVERNFAELASSTVPAFRFFGNVRVGRDVSLRALLDAYDVVVLASGTEDERTLGVAGEADNDDVHGARDFVSWYNGHPDVFADADADADAAPRYDLSRVRSAVVVGNGNVALDVARVLAKPAAALANTDVSSACARELERSAVREVHVVGRRGPAQAAYTSKELKELFAIDNCRVVLRARDFELNDASLAEMNEQRAVRRQIDWLRKRVDAPPPATDDGDASTTRTVYLRYLESPVSIERIDDDAGDDAGGGRLRVTLVRNRLDGDAGAQRCVATDERTTIECDAVFRSVGYTARLADSFDGRVALAPSGTHVYHDAGRVLDASSSSLLSSPSSSPTQPIAGLYACGWIKRGPSGIVGTNKFDAQETVASIIGDHLRDSAAPSRRARARSRARPDLRTLLAADARATSWHDWQRIDDEERARGERVGKPREKLTNVDEMLRVVDGAQ